MRKKKFPSIKKIHTIVFDFDGIFTDNYVYINQHGDEMVKCSRSDGLGFDLFRAFLKLNNINIDFFILSKETNSVVLLRSKKLKIPCYHGISDKLNFLCQYSKKSSSRIDDYFGGLVYIGNDINDYLAMEKSAYSIAPSDAHPLIKQIANFVLKEKGGAGFVRAFIEKIIQFEKLKKDQIYELISNC